MTGSHEVRGSIPLGSTIIFNGLEATTRWPLRVLCAYSVPTSMLQITVQESMIIQQNNPFVELYHASKND